MLSMKTGRITSVTIVKVLFFIEDVLAAVMVEYSTQSVMPMQQLVSISLYHSAG